MSLRAKFFVLFLVADFGMLFPATAQSIQKSSDTVNQFVQPIVQRPKRLKPITRDLSGGLRFNTDGWSVFVEKGYVRNKGYERQIDKFYSSRIFTVELIGHKHPKEIRQRPFDQGGAGKAKKYAYGKVNNFYSLKLGYGIRTLVAGKPEAGTISIHWVNNGGIALGLLKPYYIDAFVPQDNQERAIKYTPETAEAFLNEFGIKGSSGFTTGIGEIKIIPGIHYRTALHFDFAKSKREGVNLSALELGLAAEYYTQKIELMANNNPQSFFINFFAAIQFGRRY